MWIEDKRLCYSVRENGSLWDIERELRGGKRRRRERNRKRGGSGGG